jgi:hypothetical protein
VTDSSVQWIFPVVLDAFENENLSHFVDMSAGVIAYGGSQMNKASRFDSLRQLFTQVPEDKLKIVGGKSTVGKNLPLLRSSLIIPIYS